MHLPIEDYAMIGDCQTAALVGRNGSIDWLCLPSFPSPACFTSLLGKPEHGRWQICPAGEVREVRRRYRGPTVILETEFVTDQGRVTLIDFMPPRTGRPDLFRIVVGEEGTVRMKLDLSIRFDYGSIIPWVRRTETGLHAVGGPDTLAIHSSVPLRGHNHTTVAEFEVRAGERLPFEMVWHPSHRPAPEPADAEAVLTGTGEWWTEWAQQCTYRGRWQDTVLRSLITLKALTYAPTGGIVAAPTTSLPEKIGGVRNWDYRYCWVRDATFTLYALLAAGYQHEAVEWRNWLMRAVAGTPSQLHIMYGIKGERRLPESELHWLPGYRESRPVRIGNAAWDQFQLDVFGEVADMLHLTRRNGVETHDDAWSVEKALMDFLTEAWREPDEGIWEVRGPRRHFTHSKMMAWVAVDRMVKAVERFGQSGPVDDWRKLRAEIHQDVCDNGFDRRRNTFVQYYGGDPLDAAVLMMPLVGFLPADDPRMQGTVDAIQEELSEDGFIHRYSCDPEVDGLPEGEGTFLPCSFWMVDNLALMGRKEEALELFERLLGIANDVGLLAEEYDPAAGHLLGNFPQAFTHVGLINSALNLSEICGPALDRCQC